MVKLTKRVIDAAAPGAAEFVMWDDALAGFGLRIYPSGKKTFALKYRGPGGRQRWLTLGAYGPLTPEQARRMAQDRLAEVRHGGDPAQTRAAERAAATMGELFDTYIERHVEPHNKPRTAEGVRAIVRLHLRPALGALKVAAVTPADVARLHAGMRTTPRLANHAVAVLSKAMSLAERWGMRPRGTNPCLGLARYRENARDRVLSAVEMQRLGEVLRDAEGRENPTMLAAVLLLLLSGRRVSEICGLRWGDVDLEAGSVRLGETKAGGVQYHALGAGAVRVLDALPRGPASAWLLPSPRDPKKALSARSLSQVWERLRAAAGIEDVRLHDLRHGFATLAAAGGANAFTLRDALGHRTLSVTQAYVARSVEPMRALVDSVGARVLEGLALDVGGPVAVAAAGRFDPAADVLTVRLGEAGGGEVASDGRRRMSETAAPPELVPVFDDAGALVAVEIRGASTVMPALRPAVERAAAVRRGSATDNLSFAGAGERAAAAADERRAAPPSKKISRRRRAASRKSQPSVVKRK